MDFDKHCVVNRDCEELGYYELIIKEVKSSDAGKYSCTAYNKYGTATCDATLTIVDEKNVFGDLPIEKVMGPNDKPHFVWKKDNQPFEPDERFKVLLGTDDDSLALVFQHVKPEDAGLYTCVAQTQSGNIFCSAELTVQGIVQPTPDPSKPTIIVDTTEISVAISASAILECRYTGYPKPDLVWKHNGKIIERSEKYK